MSDLTLKTPDSTGGTPDQSLIGLRLLHLGNGKTYLISGFCWLGEVDEWGYLHAEVRDDGLPGVPIARPLHHISGCRSNGQPRYERVF